MIIKIYSQECLCEIQIFITCMLNWDNLDIYSGGGYVIEFSNILVWNSIIYIYPRHIHVT